MEEKYLGKRLDGRYEIKEIIGVGGMAVVYKANDLIENRTVAVKILKDEYADNEEFVRRFINEARAISVLNHTNIVKVYDASVSVAVKYMVMEYIDGITLKEYIENHGSLGWKETVFFVVQILRALQHAHDKGIVHRDVKPQNIMLLSDGTVKVADFGIARFARSSQQTITDKAIGSVHYISPEQARGEVTDEKADIYSVGVIMYEMLTGILPFRADSAVSVAIMQLQDVPKNPSEIDSSIPKGVEQITLHAMKKDSRMRYQSAAEMLHDLEEFRRDPDMVFDFSYFVDDEPTRFVNIGKEEDEYTSKRNKKKGKDEEHSVMLPVLSGIAAAFVIAIIIIGSIFAYSVLSNNTTGHTVVDFRGHKYEQVIQDYGNVFTFEPKYEYSADYEPGTVIAQSKPKGQVVKKTQTIVLTISQGHVQTEVPEIIDLLLKDARVLLDRANLSVVVTYVETEAYTPNTVMSCNPPENSLVNEGTVITLEVAQLPGAQMVSLPDVKKNKLDSAKNILEAAGLTINGEPVEVYSNGYTLEGVKLENFATGLPEGYVAAQSPDILEGEEIEQGTAVTLYVSNGKVFNPVNLAIGVNSNMITGEKATFVIKIDVDGTPVKFTSPEFDPSNTATVNMTVGIGTEKNETAGKYNVEIFFSTEASQENLYIIYEVDFATGAMVKVLDNSAL